MTFFGDDSESHARQIDCERQGGTWYDSGPGANTTAATAAAPWIAPEPMAPMLPAMPMPTIAPPATWPWWAWMLAGALAWSLLSPRRST